MSPTGEYLKVSGSEITLHGEPVLLKGAGLGGWMNMENFITGEGTSRASIPMG